MSHTTFTITLAGSASHFPNPAGDTLLRAGLRAGLGLAYECSAGGCGSCKCEILTGAVEDLWPEAPGLSAKDRAKGRRLACQCRPLSDCTIKMRSGPEFVAQQLPARFAARYLGSRAVTQDIREFRFRAPQPARFAPGQYALLDLPGLGQPRAYSMSNLPNDAGDWHFMVRQVPQGRAGALLFERLQVGDSVAIDGPLGLAQLRLPTADYAAHEAVRDVVCIAGGSGLAPMLSIANAAAQDPVLQQHSIQLFYGGRSPADIPVFGDWLVQPARVQVHAAVSSPAAPEGDGWQGPRGFVHELLELRLQGAFADHAFYLAGPPPMIEVLVRLLVQQHQVPAGQIHYDRFF